MLSIRKVFSMMRRCLSSTENTGGSNAPTIVVNEIGGIVFESTAQDHVTESIGMPVDDLSLERVLAKQTVGALVDAALPRAVRVGK